jgi:putative ABC transport system permease protein
MTALLLVMKSLRQHLVSTSVSVFAVALAGGLLMAVWVIKDEANRTFASVSGGFDAVLGPRSSKLQLVLNSLFHLDESPGTITAADVESIKASASVDVAVPIAVGDNYRGYRLVGTTHEMFERVEHAPGQRFEVLPSGRLFEGEAHEAVLGSHVADALGLKPGAQFHPFHGLIANEEQAHSETFTVTGVLAPTNTPADRVIWISLAGLQHMSGHSARTSTDVSAVLVKLKDPASGFQMDMLYNKRGNRLTFAWPIGATVAKLFDRFSWVERVLGFICSLVVIVGTASILTSIYNSMNERRREIAVLRALGARRTTVSGAIVLESAVIAALGMLLGFVIYALIAAVATGAIRAQTGVVLDALRWHWIMLVAPLGVMAVAALLGVVPAIKAYRTDVADGLAPIS